MKELEEKVTRYQELEEEEKKAKQMSEEVLEEVKTP